MEKVAVIGAGALGTALAQTVAENVDKVYLHLRREELKEEINETGFNNEYYPNTQLKDNIIATTDYDDIKDCKVIILAIPSSAFRSVLKDLNGLIREDAILVTTAKGIEYPSLKTMGKLIEEYFDDIIGVTNYEDTPIETIVLRIANKDIGYIRTKPLHWSQTELKERETPDSVYIQIKVKINTELKMLLFSYNDAIEVISPQSLRDEFADKIAKMQSFYQV